MSTKPYDPFERGNIHSLAEVREIFGTGADGRKAARLHRENKPKYDQLRKDAEILGVLSQSRMPMPVPYTKNYEAPNAKRYSSRELEVRGRWSEQEIRDFFADAKKSNDLFNSDRDEYELRRLCAVSYGRLPAREVPYVPTPRPVVEPEPKMVIGDALADESNIPRGTEVTWAQLEQLIHQSIERRAEADSKAREAKSDNAG